MSGPVAIEPVAHAFSMWPAGIALDVFDAYLAGTTPEECARRYVEQITTAQAPGCDEAADPALHALLQLAVGSPAMVRQDFAEQLGYFRTLEEDEEYFDAPKAFVADHGVPLALDVRKELVARYYAVDRTIARHLFGLRLAKNEVDCVATYLEDAVAEVVVRRTADNIRRAHRLLLNGYRQREGVSLTRATCCVAALGDHLQLPEAAAREYACVSFAAEYHLRDGFFAHLPVESMYALCEAVMETWCEPSRFHVAVPFAVSMAALSRALGDTRTINELRGLVLGVGPSPGLPSLLAKLVPASSPVPTPAPQAPPASPDPSRAAPAPAPGPAPANPAPPVAWPAVSSKALDDFQTTVKALARACRLLGHTPGDINAALRIVFLRLCGTVGASVQAPKPLSRAVRQASYVGAAASTAVKTIAYLSGGPSDPDPVPPAGLPGLDVAATQRLCAVIGRIGDTASEWLHAPPECVEHSRNFFLVVKLALTLLSAA